MIICICHGISDRDVDQMLSSGAETPAEISKNCGLGTDCGMCLRKLRDKMKISSQNEETSEAKSQAGSSSQS